MENNYMGAHIYICRTEIALMVLIHFILQGQIRGRTEIAPDQRERYLQKLQQVQQQGQSALLNMPSFVGGNSKQFSAQQQNPLLQQVPFLCIFSSFTQNLKIEYLLSANCPICDTLLLPISEKIYCIVRKLTFHLHFFSA